MPTKKDYLVTILGSVREVYYVEAESKEEALAYWHEGTLKIAESFDMDESTAFVTEDKDE